MLRSTSLHNLSSDIAQELRKQLPNNSVSASKIKDCISKTLGSNPSELTLLLELHGKHVESGARASKGIVCTFYNIQRNDTELAWFEHSGSKLTLIGTQKISLADLKLTKRFIKGLHKYSNARGLDICWLKCSHNKLEGVKEFTTEILKKFPPESSVKKLRFSFSRDVDNFVSEEDKALGVIFRTHISPYLPIQINYFVGNLDNPELKFLGIIDENNARISDLSIENPIPSHFEQVKSIPLKSINLLTQPFSETSVIFDLIHLGLKYDFDKIKETYSFKERGITKELKLIPLNTHYIVSGKSIDENDQRYQEFDSNTIFDKGLFEVRLGPIVRTKIEIDSSIPTVANPLEKAFEFHNLLEKVKSF